MPQNKKQHYVPRFYLKRFSPDGHSISLWNIKNEIRVTSANLKHQCYKDYFYGKELKVEKALGLVEGHTSEILRLIDKHQSPPPFHSEEYLTLVLYMLMQYGRTAYSADALDEMNDKIVKHLFGPKADAEGIDLSKFTIGIKDSAQYSLGMISQLYPLMLDLDCKLLLNTTNVEFVTSDNPVVLYNQLFSFRQHGSNTGLVSKGLQVFLPVSASQLLIFYDYESYSVGSRSKATVEISSPRDVYELNTLQMVSAYENIYFENKNFDVAALYRKASPFRRVQKSKMSIFPGEEDEKTKKEFMTTSREDIRTNLKLSFINLTKNSKTWRIKFRKLRMQPAVVVRDEELFDNHDKFMKEVDDGKFQSGDFFKYLSEINKKS
jgi:hypothetical protein